MSEEKEKSDSKTVIISDKPERKVVHSTKKTVSGVPTEISNDPELIEAMSILPENYDFEIPKTIWKIKSCNAKCVALQFPEGLLLFSVRISDILEKFTGVETFIVEDFAYGKRCMDDALALGVDLLVYYGHSCLIPPKDMTDNVNILCVSVNIKIDTVHALQIIEKNFDKTAPLGLISTIQFVSSLQHLASDLKSLEYNVEVPQRKPFSPGEVLGCISPKIRNSEIVIFIGEDRFHLESVMIANPHKKFFRYNPYDKTITEEEYDHAKILNIRKKEVERARSCEVFGVISGPLGGQGTPKVLETIQLLLEKSNKKYVHFYMEEIFPERLNLYTKVEAWVQIACPRLSVDWSYTFEKPLLTPYELVASLKNLEWKEKSPMDFYASESLGLWTPNHKFSVEDSDKICGNCDGCCLDRK